MDAVSAAVASLLRDIRSLIEVTRDAMGDPSIGRPLVILGASFIAVCVLAAIVLLFLRSLRKMSDDD